MDLLRNDDWAQIYQARDETNPPIAKRFRKSPRTVQKHLAAAVAKLGVNPSSVADIATRHLQRQSGWQAGTVN